MTDDASRLSPAGSVQRLVRLAELYGINPYVTFEDVWPFGDPHDVGKVHPQLVLKIEAREAEIAALKANTKLCGGNPSAAEPGSADS